MAVAVADMIRFHLRLRRQRYLEACFLDLAEIRLFDFLFILLFHSR